MARRETKEVLRKARGVLDMARLGLSDLCGDDPRRRTPGFWNAVTFGRDVSFVVQNLRTIDTPAFNAWYEPRKAAMRADPLLQYFNKLRSVIEKEGGPTTGSSLYIESLNTDDLADVMAHRPPGAKAFFIGDALGGSGWIVELPDGRTENFYVTLPEAVRMTWSMTLPDAPTTHLGKPITDTSAQHLCALYIDYMSDFLAAAETQFGT